MRNKRLVLLPTSALFCVFLARLFCGILAVQSDESRHLQIGRLPGWDISRVTDHANDSPALFSIPGDEHGSFASLLFEWTATSGLVACLICTLIGWGLFLSWNRIVFLSIAGISIFASAAALTLGMARRHLMLFHCDHEANRFLLEWKPFPVVPSTFIAPGTDTGGFTAVSEGLMGALDTVATAAPALAIILIWSATALLAWNHHDKSSLDR